MTLSIRAHVVWRSLLAMLVVAGVLAAPAAADASPRMQFVHAKRLAVDTAKTYANHRDGTRLRDGNVYTYTDAPEVSCKRRSRSVVDCQVDVLFYDEWEVCRDRNGYDREPGGEEWHDEHGCYQGNAAEAETYVEGWDGVWHSWTMRYRAQPWEGHYIAHEYLKRGRGASIDCWRSSARCDPRSRRFSGLRFQHDNGVYQR